MLTTYEFVPPDILERLADVAGIEPVTLTAPSIEAAQTLPELTKREREVLAQLPTGRPLSDIAGLLYISPNTLKATLRRLYRKLGVASRHEAAEVARGATL